MPDLDLPDVNLEQIGEELTKPVKLGKYKVPRYALIGAGVGAVALLVVLGKRKAGGGAVASPFAGFEAEAAAGQQAAAFEGRLAEERAGIMDVLSGQQAEGSSALQQQIAASQEQQAAAQEAQAQQIAAIQQQQAAANAALQEQIGSLSTQAAPQTVYQEPAYQPIPAFEQPAYLQPAVPVSVPTSAVTPSPKRISSQLGAARAFPAQRRPAPTPGGQFIQSVLGGKSPAEAMRSALQAPTRKPQPVPLPAPRPATFVPRTPPAAIRQAISPPARKPQPIPPSRPSSGVTQTIRASFATLPYLYQFAQPNWLTSGFGARTYRQTRR